MRRLIPLALLALVASACAGGEADPAGESAGRAAVVGSAETELDEILVSEEGMALYVFDVDTADQSACYDQCAELWPPLLTEAAPQAQDGVDLALLGTTTREDGTIQVTYDGRPLYLYAEDSAPGDTNGQGVEDVWWVVAPSGQAVTEAAGADEAPAEVPVEQDYDYDY